jgi:hypothetical protein
MGTLMVCVRISKRRMMSCNATALRQNRTDCTILIISVDSLSLIILCESNLDNPDPVVVGETDRQRLA